MSLDEINKLVKNSVERLKNIEGFEKVRFIILYGSAVEGTIHENSDIDLCIDYDAKTDYERSMFRLKVLSNLTVRSPYRPQPSPSQNQSQTRLS